MRSTGQDFVSFLTVIALPLVMLAFAAPATRRLALRLGLAYWGALLIAWLVIPFVTGFARWQSDLIFASAGGRIRQDHVEFVVAGVLLLRPLAALAVGVVLAGVARRYSSASLVAVSCLFPVMLEASTLLDEGARLLDALVPWHDASWSNIALRHAIKTCVSILLGPLLAGAAVGIMARRMLRSSSTTGAAPTPANPPLQATPQSLRG